MLTTEISTYDLLVASLQLCIQVVFRCLTGPIILKVNVNTLNQLQNVIQLPTYCDADADFSQ